MLGQLLDDCRQKLTCSRNLTLRYLSLLIVIFVVVIFLTQMSTVLRPLLLNNNLHTAVLMREAHQKLGQLMSPEEVFQYFHWANCSACRLPVDFGFVVERSGNPGGVAHPDGQKLVCLDQFIAPVYNNCLVYSFGINNQWTFDDDMAQLRCHVYAFDPSMGVEDHNRTELIHFYNLGLAKENGQQNPSGWKMKTADSIYEMLAQHHHGNSTLIDVFKMDVEFYEWEVIPQMLQSGFLASKVKQLAVEIHLKADDSLEDYQKRVGILQDLESAMMDHSSSAAGYSGAGRFVRFSSRHNPGLKKSIKILGNKDDFVGFELAWYNSRFYDSPSKPGPVFPYYQ